MKKSTLERNILENFFYSSILLACSYKMDTNKSNKSYLNSNKIINYLKENNLDANVIKYIDNIIGNNCLNGKVYYLTNKADSECMILITKTKIFIIFIGTQFYFNDLYSLGKDLFTDLNFGLTPLKNFDEFKFDKSIKIHDMYQRNMLSDNLIYNIIDILEHHSSNGNFSRKITICGHSMGCGLSLYTSIILSLKYPNSTFNLVTIESPKLGNAKLNRFLNKINNIEHYDLVNSQDVIFLFPFIYPKYTHVAKNNLIYNLTNCGKISILNYSQTKSLNFNSIYDHFLNNVLLNLYKCLIKNI